jgi:peptidoglycan hydrolase CwlO-like protein
MKDKRTYKYEKEHGEDMSHENESKIDTVSALTEQYRADLHAYKERESLHLKTENQLKGTKQIVLEMANTIRELKTQNDNFQAEISRLNEDIQLLEMQIKK